MSYFSEWELSGGLNPYDGPSEAEQEEAEHFSPCGCGDSRCRIDDRDSTNVQVNGKWFTADCVGLCRYCGEVDDLHALYREGYGRLRHVRACGDVVNERRR